MKPIRSIAFLTLALLASCASSADKDRSTAVAPPPQGGRERTMDEWVGERSKDNGFKKDASGNLVPRSEKRSPYEGKTDANFAGKSYKKEEYKAGDYAKKSWWGNKEYDRKAYSGNTDGSRFQTPSDLQGKGARETGSAANVPDNYQTGTYATGNARESTATPIGKGTSDAIENRKAGYEQPEIIDWKEQRALSVDQSKSILGN